jgi:hypothetical protein
LVFAGSPELPIGTPVDWRAGMGQSGRVAAGARTLEAFHFAPAFQLTIDPEFPGDGDWGCPVFGFDPHGRRQESPDSRWGQPIVVEVETTEGRRWVAHFAAGGLGGGSGSYATPNSRRLCVVNAGLAYLVDIDAVEHGAEIVHDQISQVTAVRNPDLLLLVRFVDMVAIGVQGVAWRTPRLAVDGLRVLSASDGLILCSADNLGGSPTITLDATTGEQRSGTRFDSIWPPGAAR